MNPVVKPLEGDTVAYQLTEEDLKKLTRIHLMGGAGQLGDCIRHNMCVMQAVACLTTEASRDLRAELKEVSYEENSGYTDNPICVSDQIATFMISLNDRNLSPQARGRLKQVIPDIVNTAPIKRTVLPNGTIVEKPSTNRAYLAAERQRKLILERAEGEKTITGALKLVREAADLYRTAPAVQ